MNEVNSCTEILGTIEKCADGTDLIAAWFSVPFDRAPSFWSAPTYNETTTAIEPTEEELKRLIGAAYFVPVSYSEWRPTNQPANAPFNWRKEAYYTESCARSEDAGNVRMSYSEEFECVENMGMHYCDYNHYTGGVGYDVCRETCASELIGKTNYPYRWSRVSIIDAVTTVCTGQPGCVLNNSSYLDYGNYFPVQTQESCNASNVGQTQEVRWYHTYGSGGVGYRRAIIECTGPDLTPSTNSCN